MKCEDKNYYLTLIIEALGLCVFTILIIFVIAFPQINIWIKIILLSTIAISGYYYQNNIYKKSNSTNIKTPIHPDYYLMLLVVIEVLVYAIFFFYTGIY